MITFRTFKLYNKWPALIFKNSNNPTSTIKRYIQGADLTVRITNYSDNLTFEISEVLKGEITHRDNPRSRNNTRKINFQLPEEVKQELINILLSQDGEHRENQPIPLGASRKAVQAD